MDLREHLESYGIRHFADQSYWEWRDRMLGATGAAELGRLRKPLQAGDATEAERRRYWDYMASEPVASAVFSAKAGAIHAAGEFVTGELLHVVPPPTLVFDIGCSIGYLTTYYATRFPDARVTGCDLSPASIERAASEAARRGLDNVTFRCGNWASDFAGERFDCVCATQVMAYEGREERALAQLAAWLPPAGRLVCVETFEGSESVQAFISGCARRGLALQSFDLLHSSDLGERSSSPGMVFIKGEQPL